MCIANRKHSGCINFLKRLPHALDCRSRFRIANAAMN
jgi:hypothetical protein